MATAVRAPHAAASAEARRPASLLPVGAARVIGYVLLATLGALEWKRMVVALPAGRALLWVAAGAVAALAVLGAERLPRRAQAPAAIAIGLLALPVAWVAAGLDLGLFRESRWPELGDGVARGVEALANVKMPYEGADPWPGRVLAALGALLCVLAGALSVWPRGRVRGYPFLSLVALLTLVAVPVISLGGTRPILLGLALAALTMVFLLLERLPLRPGLGVAALLGLALAGALPLGAAADKQEPWFDYKAFAEGLGPEDPVTFNWAHGDYGPIDWTRTGAEVLRVKTPDPAYWKVETLDGFDGLGWDVAPQRRGDFGSADDVPDDFRNQPGWVDRLEVSIRRLRGSDVIGAGTILDVRDATRTITPGFRPYSWRAASDLRRGDSYTADVYVPRPSPAQLASAPGPRLGTRTEQLELRIPIDTAATGVPTSSLGRPASYADVAFPGFDDVGGPVADFPQLAVQTDADALLRNSVYGRSWRLAQRLRRGADTPYQFVVAVDEHLGSPGYSYDERPTPVPPGMAPLDAFLFDTQAGYCQHYSAAMAMLLRMGGVPARVATGFSPGGYSKSREAWIVRDTDAHSWVEAWFEGIGWVSFDPTPPATPARSQISAIDTEPEPDAADSGDDEESGDEAGGGDAGGSGVRGDLASDPARDAATGGTGSGGGVPTWLLIAGGVLAGAGAALVVLVVRSRRTGGRLDPERSIAEFQRALRRTGREAPTGTTLSQLEQRLNLSGEAADYVRALRAGRYAPASAAPSALQRRALRRELADGLGPIGRLRVLWALPPHVFVR